MLLSMNWICDYVDLDGIDKLDLIARFSLSTAEVENDIIIKGRDIEGIVVAKITSVDTHPNNANLHVLEVDYGKPKTVTVVCGAPNVREGMKTAFAPAGSIVGGARIDSRSIDGCLSSGMCCSEEEIGISADSTGIMEIDDAAVVGTNIKEIYDVEDIIFEVDNKSLTNRPDLWGHYGIAREFSVLSGRPLKSIDCDELDKYSELPKLDMRIEDSLCYRYACIRIENITHNISPVNMRIRLYYCGMRAINLLADITNYIMLELGQPMHAFDSRSIESIRVKRLKEPRNFKTLDGIDRAIDCEMLMICDKDEPVAIAGVMGGLKSEIVNDTTSLTLESACFDPASIRKTTVRLGHRTDASMRYEKALDPELVDIAIGRFVFILKNCDPGIKITSSLTDAYDYHYPKITIAFDNDYINKYAGISINVNTIQKTLEALGFNVKENQGDFSVEVPSWRATKDVTIKADIVEEITRIYGYDNFDVNTSMAPLYPVKMEQEKSDEEQIKDLLVRRFSLHEVHSYVWPYYEEFKELGIEIEPNLALAGSGIVLRRSMAPTQLCQVNANTAFAAEFGIFEIGRVVEGVNSDTGLANERKKLCITLFSKKKSEENLYLYLRDLIVTLIKVLKHKNLAYRQVDPDHKWQHPKNLNALICDGVTIGVMGFPYPTIKANIDKKAAIVYAEIDMKLLSLVESAEIEYEEPSKYPTVEADITVLSNRYQPIKEAIDEVGSSIIREVGVSGTYDDAKGRAITVHIVFGNPEKTLTHDEVNTVLNHIRENIENKGLTLKI